MDIGKQFMKALGATEGSTTTERVNQQTGEQQELW